MTVLAIVDVETTSLDPSSGHVVEVALALYSVNHRSLVRARSWLCSAPAEAVAATQHVHGISPALVQTLGVPFATVADMVYKIASKEAGLFAAHNSDFDCAWFPRDVQDCRPWLDTCRDIDWPKPSTSRSLTAIALAHGVGVVRAHRALDDVLTLAALFERVAELGADIPALIERAMRPKVLVMVAETSFSEERNALAKAACFAFDRPTKTWRRRMAAADCAALPFATRVLCDSDV